MIDELDLALVDALRIDPRAPWSKLADPLGVDAATLSRRWARLAAEGDAWVTCYPSAERMGVGLTALVAVECRTDAVYEVAAALAADPQTPTVELVSGATDLMITVGAVEPRQVTDYVLDRVGRIPGVLRTRTAFVERTVREGSRWREGALDPAQQQAIAAGLGDPSADAGSVRGRALRRAMADRALWQALGEDGRMPVARLAERTGLPAATARRRMEELRRSGRLVLRCDASARLSGQVQATWLFLDVPAHELEETTQWLAQVPAIRMCGVLAGAAANVAANVHTHGIGDARRIEAQLGLRGGARVVDRQVVLRTVKLVGRLTDGEGRAHGYVPIDPWATP